jgi:manganese transport system ATP-binding protein
MRVIDAVSGHGVAFAYGTTMALGASNFSIPRGQVSVVIGPNGSGKSTLLSGIAGLMKPASGRLEFAPGITRHKISYVLQTTKVNEALPVTVHEVVAMGRYSGSHRLSPTDRAAVDEAMGRMGIDDIAGMHLRELSGGQRQRVFVAQGLAQDHDMLLLDEPLTGIDLPTARAIDAVIHDEVDEGCAVVMASHDLSEAVAADHVLLLSGRVVAEGVPSEVLTADNLAAAYDTALLHVDSGRLFVDDPAHQPVPGRHLHQERSIHTEGSPTGLHGDNP